MLFIEGGVAAPQGFKCNGVHCGIRKSKSKKDLALIVCDTLCNAAGVFTTNLVKGAPLLVTKSNLANGKAQAIICNSGNANTCNANGMQVADDMCTLVEKYAHVKKENVIVASTGVIGQPMDIAPISGAMKELVTGLGNNSHLASQAIMTTDTVTKSVAMSFTLDGRECRIGGIAKGSGMIHPNMATMLVFITTDVAITSDMLAKALSENTQTTFNMISVDGDTSTNDMVTIMASGKARNAEIKTPNGAYEVFAAALHTISVKLCRMIAGDGEGATKLIECVVRSADSELTARRAARSVISSNLVKAAMFGSDANWGRILCAMGNCGAKLELDKIDISFTSENETILVCQKGMGVDFDEAKAKEILLRNSIVITIDLNVGDKSATAWGCDLTYDYVRINGDYRT